MFGTLGVPELLLIFVVILIVFGPRRIPEIGRTLGKALGEFRKATDDLKSTIEREVRLEELHVDRAVAPVAGRGFARFGPRVAENFVVEHALMRRAVHARTIGDEPHP